MRHLNRRKNEKYSRMNVTVELDKEIYTWAVFILNLNVNNWYGLAKYIWFGIIISSLFKKIFLFYFIFILFYIWVFCLHICMSYCVVASNGGQRRLSLLKKRIFFELPCGCWEFICWSSEKATSAFHHWANSPAPEL